MIVERAVDSEAKESFGRLPQPRAEFLFRWCSCLKTESSQRLGGWISTYAWIPEATLLKGNDSVTIFPERRVFKPANRGYCQISRAVPCKT